MLENADYLKIIIWLMGTVVSLLIFSCGLIAWVFKEHIKDDHMQLTKNYNEHIRIFEKIDCKVDKRKR